ncbi:hypothetical protein [Bacteroides acidifaciens]|uniref:hypothetical protein n=1 Tax=Bacteroides acidifaciens TaxID=85831 RepID=UPI0026EB8634|nr:hypothetical protein [Bacteroides acidifaciens]
MNRIFLILLMVCLYTNSEAQELVVKSFVCNETDISARTEKRLDFNGNPCALIKVEAIPVCDFEGNIIGQVTKKHGAYWVYVTGNTKVIRISSDNFHPIDVRFSSFGVDKEEFGTVYTLRVESQVKSDNNIIAGHGYVDLGLSVFWADMNVGAMSIEEYGGLYGWGDGTGTIKSKNSDDYPNQAPSESICGTEFDLARQKWGGKWRLPSKAECQELLDRCIIIDEELFGTLGVRVIGPNGNSIFIPKAGGARFEEKTYYRNSCVHVWTGNCQSKEPYKAWSLMISDLHAGHVYNYDRSDWHSIRPVARNEKYKPIEYYKQTIRNGKCLIKGQIRRLLKMYPEKITIYEDSSNKILATIGSEQELFEVWVSSTSKLRFEADGYKTVISELKDNLIITLETEGTPSFGLG